MDVNKIGIFGLDDDELSLEEMKYVLDSNNIKNYKLFREEAVFCKEFNDSVHIAIIDHYLNGKPRGFEIMNKINEHNRKAEFSIDCRLIIISGIQDAEVIEHYLNEGAEGYIRKQDPLFHEKLAKYVLRAIGRVDKIMRIIKMATMTKEFLNENNVGEG